MVRRVKIAEFDGVGGPAAKVKAPDGFTAGPTDAGVYRIARCGRHSSPSYPMFSRIRWGSPLKEEGGVLKVLHEGKWTAVTKVSGVTTKEAIMQRHNELYGRYEVPKTWNLNDFGHITCYFFKDKNGNKRLDKNEDIHREYFHTTPDDEATTAAGNPVTLTESHGCIHLRPKDIDELIARGYFASGNMVVVHKYSEKVSSWSSDAKGIRPFEVHFFPGAKKVIVTGRLPGKRARD